MLGDVEVDEVLPTIRERVPMFSELNPLMLRELMLEATIHRLQPGEIVFERIDFTTTFFAIVGGAVGIEIDSEDPSKVVGLGQGEFFGEMGLIAGRRRTATVRATEDAFLFEVPAAR